MRTNSNKTVIISLLLRLICMTFVCFLTSTFVFSSFNSQPIRAFLHIACIVVTIGLVYPPLHHLGGVDRNLADAGQIKPNMLKGLYLGLAANSPFILTGVLLILSKLGLFTTEFYGIYKLINAIYYAFNSSILPTDDTILTVGWLPVLASVGMLFLVPIITMFAYIIGYYRFLYKEAVFYKKKA